MCGETHRERVVIAAQPARGRIFDGHQIGDGLCTIVLQLALLLKCERLQISRHLMVMRRDEDETFALWSLLELEDAMNSLAIARITTQAVT